MPSRGNSERWRWQDAGGGHRGGAVAEAWRVRVRDPQPMRRDGGGGKRNTRDSEASPEGWRCGSRERRHGGGHVGERGGLAGIGRGRRTQAQEVGAGGRLDRGRGGRGLTTAGGGHRGHRTRRRYGGAVIGVEVGLLYEVGGMAVAGWGITGRKVTAKDVASVARSRRPQARPQDHAGRAGSWPMPSWLARASGAWRGVPAGGMGTGGGTDAGGEAGGAEVGGSAEGIAAGGAWVWRPGDHGHGGQDAGGKFFQGEAEIFSGVVIGMAGGRSGGSLL